jgi:hypothetical protein
MFRRHSAPPVPSRSWCSRAAVGVSRAALGLVALAASAPLALADTVQFADGGFGAAWVSAKVVDTTPGASATFTSVTTGADGLPPPCRETSHTYDNGAIVVLHLDTSAVYDPATGPLCEIDGAYDLIHYPGPAGGAVRYRMAIVQYGSVYHHTAGTDVGIGPWASYIVPGLTANAFTKISGTGPATPDFSCAGEWMYFGFTTSNSAGAGGPFTKVSAIDNWSVTLHVARQTIFDGDFQGAWTSMKIADSTPGQAATFSAVTQLSGGNPVAYREVTHTLANGFVYVSHFDPANTYDPSTMPVYQVDVSYDLRHFTPSLGAVRYHAAVEQGGNYFIGPFDDIFPDAWSSFSHPGLVASSFNNLFLSPVVHPDFSNTGAPFRIGYITSNSVNGGPVTKVSGIDNFRVVLELSPRCATITGTPYCFGDGSGPPCPCSPGIAPGIVGRGCPNSLFGSGALLGAVGTPSIGNDTLSLRASAMPNSTCIYFQGTLQSAVPVFDGISCVTGTVVRLGTKTNVCSASQYPDAGNQSVSVRGSITTPGTFYYQTWYRNSASFCTPATSNYTNGLAVTWTL